ncbi:MAG: hypothetical protein KME20_13645 [Kaiparowitsia implicata GSE-PSE-MK54-09C]|jgi:hypothetical protein|nr:hypothetical protein [Kaiparowitsia implicata GSE-PSE-MK54-09C]
MKRWIVGIYYFGIISSLGSVLALPALAHNYDIELDRRNFKDQLLLVSLVSTSVAAGWLALDLWEDLQDYKGKAIPNRIRKD